MRTIGSLLHVLTEDSHQSQASIIRHIDDLFGHIPGIAKSTLERDLKAAKDKLKDY